MKTQINKIHLTGGLFLLIHELDAIKIPHYILNGNQNY